MTNKISSSRQSDDIPQGTTLTHHNVSVPNLVLRISDWKQKKDSGKEMNQQTDRSSNIITNDETKPGRIRDDEISGDDPESMPKWNVMHMVREGGQCGILINAWLKDANRALDWGYDA